MKITLALHSFSSSPHLLSPLIYDAPSLPTLLKATQEETWELPLLLWTLDWHLFDVHFTSKLGLQEEEEEEEEMQEEKWKKVKKGWLAVRVGLEGDDGGGFRRFTMPISYLHHPHFKRLLEVAHEVYGYRCPGPLRLPCSVDDFLHLRWLIERESQSHHHHHHHRISSFSLHSDA